MTIEKELLSTSEADKLAAELKVILRNGEKPKNDPDSINKMVAGLGDPRGLIRRTFAEALGVTGSFATPALREALIHNKNVTIRRAAAKALKLVADPSALPDLLKALITDEDPVVQGSSVGAIAIFGEKAIDLLQVVLLDPKSSAMQKGLATWGIAFAGAEAPEAIKNASKSKHEAIRAAAIAALGGQIQSLEDEEAKKILIQAIDDKSSKVRAEATALIGGLESAKWAESKLKAKLNDKSAQVRKNSALSLMKLQSKNSLEEIKLRKMLEKDPQVLKVLELAIKHLKEN
ncbi:HEAT repeat domain-containing protein [Prochlorococcus sp. MIT 1341]|uniref:HEAT repeat domain-containing protein n=1 Tax=Prochlorococcus sp. MIT 1341 TaxID=3096221 RepID=UPI002A764259|nr:HEAT repeat domain-containing protein [Prochlorococcus sp. MIT 1341]